MTQFIKTAEAVIEKVRDDKRYTTLFSRLFDGKDIEDGESKIDKHDEVMMNLLAYYSEADVSIMTEAFMMSKRAEGRLTADGVKKLADEAAAYMTDKGTLYHWPANADEAWEQLISDLKRAKRDAEDDFYEEYVDMQKKAWLDGIDNRQKQIDALKEGTRKENAQNQLNALKTTEFKPKYTKAQYLGMKKGLPFDRLAEIFIEKLHLKRLYTDTPKNALLYWYDPSKGVYTHRLYGDKSLETFMVFMLDDGVSLKRRTDFVKVLEVMDDPRIKYEKTANREEFFACNNGVLETATGTLHPFNPKYPITAKIDTDYVDWANRPEPEFDDYKTGKPWKLSDSIKELGTDAGGKVVPGKETLLWEVLKCGVLGISRMRQAAILVDDNTGHTGKSTFEEIVENTVGLDNICQLKLVEFGNENKLRNLEGAITVIGDDNREGRIVDCLDILNPMLDHRPIYTKYLFKDIVAMTPDCFVIQSYNGRPIFDGATEAAFERLCIINFTGHVHDLTDEASVAIKKPHLVGAKFEDPYITRKEFKEWVLWYVVNHVKVGVHLTETEESKQEKEKLLVETDDISNFIESYLPQLHSKRVPMGFMYDYYSTCCENDGNKPRKSTDFFRQLRANARFKQDWVQEKGRLKLQFDVEDAQMLVGMQRAGRFGYGYKTFFPTVTHTTGSESDKVTRLELDREATARKIKTYNGWVFVRQQ